MKANETSLGGHGFARAIKSPCKSFGESDGEGDRPHQTKRPGYETTCVKVDEHNRFGSGHLKIINLTGPLNFSH